MSPRLALRAVLALALAASAAAGRADEKEDHWEGGAARPFLAGEADLGSSEHLALMAGWGKPHNMWGGLVAHGFLTNDFAAGRVGARVDLLAVALEGGVRWTRSFAHLPLPDVARHDALPTGQHGFTSRTLDLSASGGLPLGPGFAIYELLGVRRLSEHGDAQLYDEVNRIVYRGRWLATASAGWLAALRGGALLAGARAQWAYETGRGGDPFVRAGPVVYWRAWPHVAVAGELLYPVSNPDRTAFVDPIQAFVVFAFTAASGDRPPRFP